MPPTHSPPQPSMRQVRSFVRRGGRLTKAQAAAKQRLWPLYGIEPDHGRLDLATLFGAHRPVTLEIGFGNGQSLAQMAQADPKRGFLGIEVHEPGIGQLLRTIEAEGLGNLRLIQGDALELLETLIEPGTLDRIQLYFPDPWPKKKHHKRRIVGPEFCALVVRSLRSGGLFHMATDWEPYAEAALERLENTPGLINLSSEGFSPRPVWRPKTKFERRGQRVGHRVRDLMLQRVSG